MVACGDSTAPNANLSDEHLADMMDAMSAVGAFSVGNGATLARAQSLGNAAIANAMASVAASVNETIACPNGGNFTLSGNASANEATGSATIAVKQDYNACKGTSASGREWTFDGDPFIALNVSMTVNQTTGAFTMTGTEKGGIKFSSDIGSGHCSIDISISLISTGQGAVSGSVSGQVCGKPVDESIAQ